MKHLFIINPKSFFKAADIDSFMSNVRAYFHTKNGDEYHIHISRYPRDAFRVIRRYSATHLAHKEILRVYAVGGDGILYDCLNGVMGLKNTVLASVPYGNTNDFLQVFGEDNVMQFRTIESQAISPAIPVDVINCGNNCALNFCTIGLEAYAVSKQQNFNRALQLRPFTPLLHFLSGIAAILNQAVLHQQYQITIDGEDYSGQYGAINIANAPCYEGNKCAVPTAIPNDGLLDILLFHHASTANAAAMLPHYRKGRYRRFPGNFTYIQGKEISVHSASPLYVDLDGEVFLDNKIDISIMPGAVSFVAVNGLKYAERSIGNE